MTRQKKIMFGAGGAVLAVAITALVVALSGQSGPRRSRADNAPARPQRQTPRPAMLCVVRVNESRGMRLDSGSPLYVQCIFNNPLADRAVSLPAAGALKPTVRNAEGTELSISWKPVGPMDRSLGAGANAIYTWRTAKKVGETEELKAGTYQVTIELPKGFPPPACGLDGIRVEQAAMKIVDAPPNTRRNAAFARRLDLLAGRSQQVIEQLRGRIADNPGNDLDLRMELIDALDAAGMSDGARKELLDVGYEIQHAEKGKRRAIPPWLAFRLEDLKSRSESN